VSGGVNRVIYISWSRIDSFITGRSSWGETRVGVGVSARFLTWLSSGIPIDSFFVIFVNYALLIRSLTLHSYSFAFHPALVFVGRPSSCCYLGRDTNWRSKRNVNGWRLLYVRYRNFFVKYSNRKGELSTSLHSQSTVALNTTLNFPSGIHTEESIFGIVGVQH